MMLSNHLILWCPLLLFPSTLPISLMKKLKLGEGKDVPASPSWTQWTHTCRGVPTCDSPLTCTRGSPDLEEGGQERRCGCLEEPTLSPILLEWLRVEAQGAAGWGLNPSLGAHCLRPWSSHASSLCPGSISVCVR